MTNTLKQEDLNLIQDEVDRYKKTHHKLVEKLNSKSREFTDNQEEARKLTMEMVATRRDEEKQALQSDEMVAHALAKLRKEQTHSLSDLVRQPYFARVIYSEKGRETEFKLGLASVPELRIVDWRKAPISKLYYDYEEGDAYDDEIADVDRKGKILLRRSYRGVKDILAAIELKETSYIQTHGQWNKQRKYALTPFSIHDKEKIKQLMQHYDAESLHQAEEESGYLHQILSLLSPEQFQLISTEVGKPVIVQGSAGTGKTTVALHRLAWLLFEDNSPAKEEATLVVMFNKSLAAYVKHVLPELGIQQIKIVTYFEWALDIIETSLNIKLNLSQEDIPLPVAQFKARHQTMEHLNQYVKDHPDIQSPLDTLHSFYLSKFVQAVFAPLSHGESIQKYFKSQQEKNHFDLYDLGYLLHLIQMRDGFYRSKRHPVSLDYLVIDEAQDFTITELTSVLQALEDKSKLTLAGDLGQKILENRDFGDWDELLKALGLTGVGVVNLQVAYRSTYQIYELAEFIRDPKLKESDLHLTPKFGPEPTLTLCAGFVDAVIETMKWIDDVTRLNQHTIGAIICKTRGQARILYDALIKLGSRGVRYGDANQFEFTPGMTVTDVKQVKGLEFKNVLIFNPSQSNYSNNNLQDRNFLYVAITRAEFRADMICYESPSDMIPDLVVVKDLTIQELNEDKPLFSDLDQDLSRFEEKDKDKEIDLT